MIQTKIKHQGYNISVNIYENDKPSIILMHGFPDNSHLYDLLVPELTRHFKVITFDFLGWGNSDKPKDYTYSSQHQKMELDTVIKTLKISQPILVAHDASGPPAIDWAIENESKIKRLVLLNSYYSKMPSLRAPEAIWLFSTPGIRNIARFVSKLGKNYVFHKMYYWQVGKFFTDTETRKQFVPLLNQQFKKDAGTQHAFFKLNKDLLPTIKRSTKNLPKLKNFEKKVQIIFGENDKYLNSNVANNFHKLFKNSTLHLVKNAKHFVQFDQPKLISELIISI